MKGNTFRSNSGMTRREFLYSTTAGGTLFAMNGTSSMKSTGKSINPNLLLIMTDQHHINAIQAAGNSWLKTPAIDRLYNNGVRFTESYCTHAACIPSRSSLFTGRMPTETGLWINAERTGPIEKGIPNLGEWFQANTNYETLYAGKWHCPECHTYGIPGFQVISAGLDHRGDIADMEVGRACEAYLWNRKNDRPFLMVASFIQPHDICHWLWMNMQNQDELRYKELADELPPLPENFLFDPNEPETQKNLRENKQQPAMGEWSELQWRYYLWCYYRHVEMVDSEIGRLLTALDETGLMENTVIAFTADHGEGMGHHKMVRKQFLYDEAAKVPLIFHGAGISNNTTVNNQLVSGLDIVPTLCDFAGITPPAAVKGLSLKPTLEGKQELAGQHDFIVCNQSSNAIRTGNVEDTGRMIRTRQYKYICYLKDETDQLFDMKNDPGETKNLAQNPSYHSIVQEHRKLLREWEQSLAPAERVAKLGKAWETLSL